MGFRSRKIWPPEGRLMWVNSTELIRRVFKSGLAERVPSIFREHLWGGSPKPTPVGVPLTLWGFVTARLFQKQGGQTPPRFWGHTYFWANHRGVFPSPIREPSRESVCENLLPGGVFVRAAFPPVGTTHFLEPVLGHNVAHTS